MIANKIIEQIIVEEKIIQKTVQSCELEIHRLNKQLNILRKKLTILSIAKSIEEE